ncbi:MAG: type I methionyl aminopeptidase [Candidatus Pacebacteria bacterium]|nr:type I methionyl aminopeptidase [Candidatus Paceibacterota bacterium]
MTISIKTKEDIEVLREGGRNHAVILKKLVDDVGPGISTEELDSLCREYIKEVGDTPAFLNYRPQSSKRPFPAALCVSVNEVIVHGIPTENPIILKDGDIVTIDLGLKHKGLITDAAITVQAGEKTKEGQKLIESTREAMYRGIKAIKPGRHIGDIGEEIERYVEKTDYYIADDLAGHGVGYSVHEEPYVPNTGVSGEGEELLPGMVLAIEPMLCEGGGEVVFERDDYTVRTKNRLLSAHFEHTVLVTESGYEILTSI